MEKTKNITYIDHKGIQKAFLPADVLSAFSSRFLNEVICREWILRRLHRKGALCPRCKSQVKEASLQRFWSNERIKCCDCGKYFTAISGTFISGVHLSFSEIILLTIFLAINMPAPIIAEKLGVDPETVRLWKKRFNRKEGTESYGDNS